MARLMPLSVRLISPQSSLYAFLYVTDNGKLYAQLNIGLTEKTIVVGEGLGDDMWHSVKLERRAMVITFSVDDERPLIGTIFPTFPSLPQ